MEMSAKIWYELIAKNHKYIRTWNHMQLLLILSNQKSFFLIFGISTVKYKFS